MTSTAEEINKIINAVIEDEKKLKQYASNSIPISDFIKEAIRQTKAEYEKEIDLLKEVVKGYQQDKILQEKEIRQEYRDNYNKFTPKQKQDVPIIINDKQVGVFKPRQKQDNSQLEGEGGANTSNTANNQTQGENVPLKNNSLSASKESCSLGEGTLKDNGSASSLHYLEQHPLTDETKEENIIF